MGLELCQLINLPKIQDARGNLSFIQACEQVPFEFRRVYYLYDVPSGSTRGGHAHLKLKQFMICLSGSFDVILDDGMSSKRLQLNRPYQGLYICPMIWRELENFSANAVCMVIASDVYQESDYIRDLDTFKLLVKSNA
ncbi:WxcM-like domain-containing protein [bacterium]|nr:WxcM-like domain-containing protein [bacterium]